MSSTAEEILMSDYLSEFIDMECRCDDDYNSSEGVMNDWNMIMCIVHTIEKFDTTVNISGNVCKIQLHKYPYFNVCEHGGPKLQVTRRALVKFIKWLNEYRQTCPSFLKEGLDSHV